LTIAADLFAGTGLAITKLPAIIGIEVPTSLDAPTVTAHCVLRAFVYAFIDIGAATPVTRGTGLAGHAHTPFQGRVNVPVATFNDAIAVTRGCPHGRTFVTSVGFTGTVITPFPIGAGLNRSPDETAIGLDTLLKTIGATPAVVEYTLPTTIAGVAGLAGAFQANFVRGAASSIAPIETIITIKVSAFEGDTAVFAAGLLSHGALIRAHLAALACRAGLTVRAGHRAPLEAFIAIKVAALPDSETIRCTFNGAHSAIVYTRTGCTHAPITTLSVLTGRLRAPLGAGVGIIIGDTELGAEVTALLVSFDTFVLTGTATRAVRAGEPIFAGDRLRPFEATGGTDSALFVCVSLAPGFVVGLATVRTAHPTVFTAHTGGIRFANSVLRARESG